MRAYSQERLFSSESHFLQQLARSKLDLKGRGKCNMTNLALQLLLSCGQARQVGQRRRRAGVPRPPLSEGDVCSVDLGE